MSDLYYRLVTKCHHCGNEHTNEIDSGSGSVRPGELIPRPPSHVVRIPAGWGVVLRELVCVGGELDPFLQPRTILHCGNVFCLAEAYRKITAELDAAFARVAVETKGR